MDAKTTDEIDDLLEEANDSDMERSMQAYRAKRLKEMKQEQKLHRFGDLLPISRDDYTREVAETSKVDEDGDKEGRGTGVICLLYIEGSVVTAKTLTIIDTYTKSASPKCPINGTDTDTCCSVSAFEVYMYPRG